MLHSKNTTLARFHNGVEINYQPPPTNDVIFQTRMTLESYLHMDISSQTQQIRSTTIPPRIHEYNNLQPLFLLLGTAGSIYLIYSSCRITHHANIPTIIIIYHISSISPSPQIPSLHQFTVLIFFTWCNLYHTAE